MDQYESLNHTKWECKHHVVLFPKCRRKGLDGSLRKHLGSWLRDLARHKECEIGEGRLTAVPGSRAEPCCAVHTAPTGGSGLICSVAERHPEVASPWPDRG